MNRVLSSGISGYALFFVLTTGLCLSNAHSAAAQPSATTATDTAPLAATAATSTIATATASATSTAVVDTFATDQFATRTQIFNEEFERSKQACVQDTFSRKTLEFIVHNYNRVEDFYIQRVINDTIGCVAISEDEPAVCDLFGEIPESEKSNMAYESYIGACKDRVAWFRVMDKAFKKPGACKPALTEFCESRGLCDNQPPGKICTCGLFAAVWCGIPSVDTVEQCNGLREAIAGEIEDKYGKEEVDAQAAKASMACKKVFLGFAPGQDGNDAGAAQILFLGGLFNGKEWPIFEEKADRDGFGLDKSIRYWYENIHLNKGTCFDFLNDLLKNDLCNSIAVVDAKMKVDQMDKELKEKQEKDSSEKDKPDNKESDEPR